MRLTIPPIVVALRAPLGEKTESQHAAFSHSVREIMEEIPNAIQSDLTYGSVKVNSVQTLATWTKNSAAKMFKARSKVSIVASVPLIIELEASAEPSVLREDGENLDGLDDASLAEFAVSMFLETASVSLAEVLLAASIARPATFQAFANERRLCASLDQECCVLAGKYGWPPILSMEVSRVIKWIRQIHGFSDHVGRGPIGRAVAAFSYIVANVHPVEAGVLWPLIGLEALYGRHVDGIKRQILEKSETLLGPRLNFKKKFSEIYDKRSAFVHGAMDLPFAYSDWSATGDVEVEEESLAETTNLAIAVLLASLQNLAFEGRTDLEFRYQRTEQPP